MKKNIRKLKQTTVIYGPPGIGKSTIIARAISLGYHAIDLEAVPASLRASVAKSITPNSGKIVGAANMQPSNFRSGVKNVGLRMDLAEYKWQRNHRDFFMPSKSGQMSLKDADKWMEDMPNLYDDVKNPDEFLASIDWSDTTHVGKTTGSSATAALSSNFKSDPEIEKIYEEDEEELSDEQLKGSRPDLSDEDHYGASY
jgi:hypothetical protein